MSMLGNGDLNQRKRWLQVTAVFCFFPLVFLFSLSPELLSSNPYELGMLLADRILTSASQLFLLYVFSYKSFGYRLLTFVLIVTSFSLTKQIGDGLRTGNWNVLSVIFWVFQAGIFIYWYSLSMNLCAQNKRLSLFAKLLKA